MRGGLSLRPRRLLARRKAGTGLASSHSQSIALVSIDDRHARSRLTVAGVTPSARLPYIPEVRGADLPSGGVPVLVPDLKGEAPRQVQERVMREREAACPMVDEKGRRQVTFKRGVGGGGVNVITLPYLAWPERMAQKNASEGRA